jgi:hypothetical protein
MSPTQRTAPARWAASEADTPTSMITMAPKKPYQPSVMTVSTRNQIDPRDLAAPSTPECSLQTSSTNQRCSEDRASFHQAVL